MLVLAGMLSTSIALASDVVVCESMHLGWTTSTPPYSDLQSAARIAVTQFVSIGLNLEPVGASVKG